MFETLPRRITAILGLTLALVVARAHATPAALEIPFQLIGNHVVVPVRFQDRDLSFILDTGAGASLVDIDVARELNVALGQPLRVAGAGPGTTSGALLPAPLPVTVGSATAGVEARVSAALDFSALSTHAGRALGGILGGDFIRRFVLEIDYEHERLRLHDPAAFQYTGKGTTLPVTFVTGFPHVRATLKLSDTESFEADSVLDVGSALQVVVTNPVVESRGLAEKLSASQPIPVGRGAGGTSDGRVARLPALQLGDIAVPGTVVVLAGKNSGVLSTSTTFETNIGAGVMRHFTMFFDYAHSRVTFQPNSLSNEPFEHDMSGLVLTTEGRPYAKRLIESVVPGLPGDTAGIKEGDRIKSIDGVAAETLPMDDIRKMFQQQKTYRIVVERDGKDVTVTMTTKRLV